MATENKTSWGLLFKKLSKFCNFCSFSNFGDICSVWTTFTKLRHHRWMRRKYYCNVSLLMALPFDWTKGGNQIRTHKSLPYKKKLCWSVGGWFKPPFYALCPLQNFLRKRNVVMKETILHKALLLQKIFLFKAVFKSLVLFN